VFRNLGVQRQQQLLPLLQLLRYGGAFLLLHTQARQLRDHIGKLQTHTVRSIGMYKVCAMASIYNMSQCPPASIFTTSLACWHGSHSTHASFQPAVH
jgi:hypothetical protein